MKKISYCKPLRYANLQDFDHSNTVHTVVQPCISLSLSEKLLNLKSEGQHLRWPDLSAAGVFRKVVA